MLDLASVGESDQVAREKVLNFIPSVSKIKKGVREVTIIDEYR